MDKRQEQNASLKNKYKSDFETLRKFVNEFDPCGLISSGAPNDEYDCLTEKLLSSVYNGKTRADLQNIIFNEMESHFGMPSHETLSESNKSVFNLGLDALMNKIGQKITR